MLSLLAHLGMAAHLGALALLYVLAAPAIRTARRTWLEKRRATLPSSAPKLAMIIPLTGNAPNMQQCLTSLLNQPGMACETYFVVRDQTDPAAALVREFMPVNPRVHLVTAGPAHTCCQKNHSLLAGIAAAGNAPEILVFCDSTHEAAPDFLVRLTAPLMEGKAVLTTTHRSVLPQDGLPDLCYFFCALGVQMLQNLPLLCQPWGGATAILRREFFAHGVDAVWARGVVDDFTMGPYLQRRGVRAVAVPKAALRTRLTSQTWGSWWDWWFRQLLYLKFCMPGTWALASMGVAGVGGLAAWAVVGAATGELASWAYLAGLTGLGVLFGRLCQRPLPAWRAGLGFLLMQGLTVPCFLATWGTNRLSWRGISYEAGFGGTVRRIVNSKE